MTLFQSIYSRQLVTSDVKAMVPGHQTLRGFQGRNGLESGPVIILDDRTLMIKDLVFKGLAPGMHHCQSEEVKGQVFFSSRHAFLGWPGL